MVSNLKQLRPQLGFAFHQLSSFKSPTFILAAIMTSRTKIGKSTILFAFIFIGLSSGAPPLDVSEFFGIPAAAAPESTPEVSMPPQSKARAGGQSDLLAQLLSSLGKILKLYSIYSIKRVGVWRNFLV